VLLLLNHEQREDGLLWAFAEHRLLPATSGPT
jgi:hypothetical protein